MSRSVAVIGVGNPARRDDGVGHAVTARVRELVAAGSEQPPRTGDGRRRAPVHVHELDGEPARLLDAWRGTDLAVVIDAAAAGPAPGTIVRTEVTGDHVPFAARPGNTHSLGIADAVALAAALDQQPGRLVVITVAGTDFGPGFALSPAVAGAVDAAAAAVMAELGDGSSGSAPSHVPRRSPWRDRRRKGSR